MNSSSSSAKPYATDSVALAVYPVLSCQVKPVPNPAYPQSLCFVQLIVRLVRSYFASSFRSMVSHLRGTFVFCIGWYDQDSVKYCRATPISCFRSAHALCKLSSASYSQAEFDLQGRSRPLIGRLPQVPQASIIRPS